MNTMRANVYLLLDECWPSAMDTLVIRMRLAVDGIDATDKELRAHLRYLASCGVVRYERRQGPGYELDFARLIKSEEIGS